MRPPASHRSCRGEIAVVVAVLVFALGIMVFGSLMFSRSAVVLSDSVDYVRQTSVERTTFEGIVRDAILAKMEVAISNSSNSLNTLLDSAVGQVNAGASGISYARSGAAPALPDHVFYPDVDRPPVSTPDLTTAGNRFLTKSFIQRGAAQVGSPLVFDFTRTVSGGISGEGKTLRVTAQLWSVPLSNWSVHAYGLPGTIPDGDGVPTAAPAGPRGAYPTVLTTLRPSPAYTPGDPTAYGHLYTAPASGDPETLPVYYRPHASLNWTVWEHIWTVYVPHLAENAENIYEFGAFEPATIAGVTEVSGTEISVDLETVPQGTLSIVDSLGGSTVTLNGSATNPSPLVVVIKNSTATRTNVILAGNNARSILVYTNNCSIQPTGGPVWEGGLFMDVYSSAAGVLSLNGIFAYGANYSPFGTLTLTLGTPDPSVLADLQSICPRVLLVSTSSQIF